MTQLKGHQVVTIMIYFPPLTVVIVGILYRVLNFIFLVLNFAFFLGGGGVFNLIKACSSFFMHCGKLYSPFGVHALSFPELFIICVLIYIHQSIIPTRVSIYSNTSTNSSQIIISPFISPSNDVKPVFFQ